MSDRLRGIDKSEYYGDKRDRPFWEELLEIAMAEPVPLEERYAFPPDVGSEFRQLLYEDRRFDEVEKKLREQFDQIQDEIIAFRYTKLLYDLGEIPGLGEDYDTSDMRRILKDYLDRLPESHFPLLLLGYLDLSEAWDHRGEGWAKDVSQQQWEDMRIEVMSGMQWARRAESAEPNDPAVYVLFLQLGRLGSADRDQMRAWYDEAVAVCAADFHAAQSYLQILKPKWGGSWSQINAFMRECEARAEDFPLLGLLWIQVFDEWHFRGYRDVNYSEPKYSKKVLELYDACIAKHPDYLPLYSSRAAFAYTAKEYERAVVDLEEVGDTFHANYWWDTLEEYNEGRAWAHAQRSRQMWLKEPGSLPYLRRAVELNPTDYWILNRAARGASESRVYDISISFADMSIAQKPDYMEPRFTRAHSLDRLGRHEEAAEEAHRALDMDPPDSYRPRLEEILDNARL